jgi:putative oxidoreductase
VQQTEPNTETAAIATRRASRLVPIVQGIMRIAVGFMFFTHGGQKLFAWFGAENPVQLASARGIAGVLEFFGGILITLGAFTQPVAFILSGEMAVAYFWQHMPGRGFWHWQNRGETVALFCFIFLFMSVAGAGALSVDAWRQRRKT